MVLDTFAGMHDGWAWGIGAIMMVLVWGTIIWGGVYLFRRAGDGGGKSFQSPPEHDAVDILRRRFAQGEIDRNEFDERLAELRRSENP